MRLSKLILACLIFNYAYAQTENEIVNDYIERFIENTEDEIDIQQFAGQLLYYIENPLDLNKASITDLYNSPFLSASQARSILAHRLRFGDFMEIYELQVLPDFSLSTIRELLPFVSIRNRPISAITFKDVWYGGEHQVLSLVEVLKPDKAGIRIADSAGPNFMGSSYQGDPYYANFRYRFDFKNQISFGLNAEKDAGESMKQNGTFTGFDYYSFYFSIKDFGKIKALQLGDFQANFGQGLTLATGLGFGKSSIITNIKRNGRGFGAYRSLRENAFLRGGAIAIELTNLELGVFVSNKKVDGNAVYDNDSLDSEVLAFTSIQEDGGLHRTNSEIADKDALNDFQTGGYLKWYFNRGSVSTIHQFRQFNRPIAPTIRPDNKFNFRGQSYSKHGLSYDYVIGSFNFFGEASYASNNSKALVAGVLSSIASGFDVSLLYREYDRNFIGFQSNGFGEASNTSNESGLFLGFELRANRAVKVLGYYDLYRNNWLRFAADGPGSGNDFWIEFNYKPNKSWEMYYRYRTETKQRNEGDGQINQLASYTLQRHRIHSSYTLHKKLTLRTRVEWNRYHQNEVITNGNLIYQDVIYKPFGSKFHLSYRIATSQIEDFNNRIYSFEQVPLYDYPMHQHTYSGLRTYLLIRYLPNRNLNVWFRYALTNYDEDLSKLTNIRTVGTGLEETIGPNRNSFTLQVRYKIR